MELTDSERQEFIELTQDTYDPELWSEDYLPFLREANKRLEEEAAQECGAVLPPATEQITQDD
jgi:hypothetical protein